MGLRWRRVLLEQGPELGRDRRGLPVARLDADVVGGRGGEVLATLAEQVVLDAEAALSHAADAQADRHQLARAEGLLEGRLGVPERKAVLALAQEVLQRHPGSAQELLVRLVAVHEDVGEKDDSSGVRVLEPDAEAVLEDCHLGSGCGSVIHRSWTPSACPWFRRGPPPSAPRGGGAPPRRARAGPARCTPPA